MTSNWPLLGMIINCPEKEQTGEIIKQNKTHFSQGPKTTYNMVLREIKQQTLF